jgi:hypothetical protein
MAEIEPEDIRDIEDQRARWLGSRGEYARIATPLSALAGGVEDIAITVPDEVRGGYIAANPSVLLHDDRRLAIVRGVNYRQAVGGITLFKKNEDCCRTLNFWVEFDHNWRPLGFKPMVDPYPPRPGAVQGYEDCRLFHSAGHYWASANFAERPRLVGEGAMGLLCEMALLRLSDDGDIEDVKALRGPWSVYHQKNWKPCPTEAEPLRWLYSSDPLMVVTPAMATHPYRPKWCVSGAWRGSSQAVRCGSGWLWVDHRPIIGWDGPRNLYLHRFVLADEKLTRIEAQSPPFVFRNYGIEFCAGLAIDGDRVVLSYSVRDAMPFLAICSLEGVMRCLGEVV